MTRWSLALCGLITSAAALADSAIWQPPAGVRQIPLWPNGAPDMGAAPRPPERVEVSESPEAIEGHTAAGVYEVTEPTLSVFPAQGKNTGVSMVVFPGGGFQMLAITLEGTEICHWMTAQGITCIVLKYRVPRSNHYWEKSCNCSITPKVRFALQDAQRAIKLVRSHAREWQLDPNKVGVIGFSAGGYLVAETSNVVAASYKAVDAADTLSSRPDFALAFYPGHLCRNGGKFDPSIPVTKDTPPTFLVQAWDDPVDDICNSTLYARELDRAGVPTEVHLFAKGGHAFGLRPTARPVSAWPALAQNWLRQIGVL